MASGLEKNPTLIQEQLNRAMPAARKAVLGDVIYDLIAAVNKLSAAVLVISANAAVPAVIKTPEQR